jgi:hypothetical protein
VTSENWFVAFVFVLAAFIVLRTLERWLGPKLQAEVLPFEVTLKRLEEALAKQAAEHAQSIAKLRTEYEVKIDALQEQVRFLLTELADARIQITQLQAPKSERITTEQSHKQTVLLIYGDANFGENDRNALQRAGADFVTLRAATKDMIRRRMQRAREDDEPYRYVHISAHGTDDFIKLTDGPADGKWWNDVLVGVEIVFLAACHSAGVADWLAGPGRAVVELDSAAADESAYMFTYLFWRAIIAGRNANDAFQVARTELPSIADQVSLRGATPSTGKK